MSSRAYQITLTLSKKNAARPTAVARLTRLGWQLDADFANGEDWRCIQFTPPGSGCSIIFGKNVTAAAPG